MKYEQNTLSLIQRTTRSGKKILSDDVEVTKLSDSKYTMLLKRVNNIISGF